MTDPKTKILVVDDDLRLRDLLQRYLTEQGFGVHTVPDAAGMDKLLGRERVDDQDSCLGLGHRRIVTR